MTKELNKVKSFLDNNGIEYEIVSYGGNYFGPEYSWQAILVAFYFDGIGNTREQRALFENYSKRNHKNITFDWYRFGAGYSCRVFFTPDYTSWKKYETAKSAAVEKYWQDRHAAAAAETIAA